MSICSDIDLSVIGISYKQAAVEVRERVSICFPNSSEKLNEIINVSGATGGVMLSTCNRTELYLSGGDPEIAQKILFGDCYSEASEKKLLYSFYGLEAVEHLFRTASGLESLILGEDEILRQIKNAYQLSVANNLSDCLINTVFNVAIATAKKVKTETGLSNIALSVGTIIVNRAKEALGGSLDQRNLLIIGMGDVGKIVLKDFIDQGVSAVVTYRDYDRTRERLFDDGNNITDNIKLVPYSERSRYYKDADIIVSATSSPGFVITYNDFMNAGTYKKHILVDLAVPRDIEPVIAEKTDSVYYNIDDLNAISDSNYELRKKKASEVSALIKNAAQDFKRQWLFRLNRQLIEQMKSYIKGKSASSFERQYRNSISEGTDLSDALMNNVDLTLDEFVFQIREFADEEDLTAFYRCLSSVIKYHNQQNTDIQDIKSII